MNNIGFILFGYLRGFQIYHIDGCAYDYNEKEHYNTLIDLICIDLDEIDITMNDYVLAVVKHKIEVSTYTFYITYFPSIDYVNRVAFEGAAMIIKDAIAAPEFINTSLKLLEMNVKSQKMNLKDPQIQDILNSNNLRKEINKEQIIHERFFCLTNENQEIKFFRKAQQLSYFAIYGAANAFILSSSIKPIDLFNLEKLIVPDKILPNETEESNKKIILTPTKKENVKKIELVPVNAKIKLKENVPPIQKTKPAQTRLKPIRYIIIIMLIVLACIKYFSTPSEEVNSYKTASSSIVLPEKKESSFNTDVIASENGDASYITTGKKKGKKKDTVADNNKDTTELIIQSQIQEYTSKSPHIESEYKKYYEKLSQYNSQKLKNLLLNHFIDYSNISQHYNPKKKYKKNDFISVYYKENFKKEIEKLYPNIIIQK